MQCNRVLSSSSSSRGQLRRRNSSAIISGAAKLSDTAPMCFGLDYVRVRYRR